MAAQKNITEQELTRFHTLFTYIALPTNIQAYEEQSLFSLASQEEY